MTHTHDVAWAMVMLLGTIVCIRGLCDWLEDDEPNQPHGLGFAFLGGLAAMIGCILLVS